MDRESSIRIDQVLHGYERGHRELATSIVLDEGSRATMLVLSDMLAASGLMQGHSSLAAYPIRGASRHVLARTWPSGKGYRPGSVWTHSLVLDYQALALVSDLLALLDLFENPGSGDHARYAQPLKLANESRRRSTIPPQDPRSVNALAQLYGDTPMQEIVVEHTSGELDELLAMSLWRQMWPGLRRGFAFSTGLTERPVVFDSDCSLRFAQQSAHPLSTPSAELQAGYAALLADLPEPGPTPLRTFIGRHVIESKQPRRLALRLATWDFDQDRTSLQQRLRHLRALTHDEQLPRLLRGVLSDAFDRVSTFEELLELVTLARNEVVDVGLERARECTRTISPPQCRRLFLAMQPSLPNEIGARLFDEMVSTLPLSTLAFAATPSNRHAMLRIRPDLVSVRTFWPEGDNERVTLIADLDQLVQLDLDDGLTILGSSLGPRTLAELLKRSKNVAPATVAELLSSENNEVCDALADWLVQDTSRLLHFVESGTVAPKESVDVLGRAQIRNHVATLDSASWLSLFAGIRNEPTVRLTEATLAVGYVCAIRLAGSAGQWLAQAVYDRLLATVRSKDVEHYLVVQLSQARRGWPLRSMLARSAIDRWPPSEGNAGALALSTHADNLHDLVDEAALAYGRGILEVTLATAELSTEAQFAVEQYLRGRQRKGSLFWWW